MPSWCSNDVSITGSKSDIDALVAKIGERFSLNTFIPYPEEFAAADRRRQELQAAGVPFKDLPEDGYNSGGKQWCIENWGTKGDVHAFRQTLEFVSDNASSLDRAGVLTVRGI